ncbi:MAG: MopE-related protein [Myxococcota bacterium]
MRFASLCVLLGLVACDCSGNSRPGADGGPDATALDAADDTRPDTPQPLDSSADAPDAATTGCSADDACGDFLDNDCDDAVDEGCPCAPGEIAPCFRGFGAQRNVGACADGEMLCEGDDEFGLWGPCEGDVRPSDEVCDVAGVDEDCNGAANDGCECADGDPDLVCGSDVGACEAGVSRCVDGRRSACEGALPPGIESCNGIDDDCDGTIDERLTRSCGTDVGACRPGTETCEAGAWGSCEGGNPATDEACDALDNDCDGETDEGVTRLCGSDEGRCVAGIETCTDGAFGACVDRIDPIAETCNNVDDDCDGTTDETLVRSCGSDVGRCVAGTETCGSGVWGACDGAVTMIAEACEGSVDEDCDGTVDEGCACTDGSTRPCGTSVGRCRTGTQLCASGMWRMCTGAVDPRPETCDGTDDDCDGTTDEGCDCITGSTRRCGTDVGVCRRGTETCDAAGRWGPCLGSVDPSPELCNSNDDDCDSSVDEGDVCPRFPPTVTCPGDRSVTVGDAVALSGGGSDPDGGSVSFAWTVVSRPAGSSANPSPANAASTTFTPDAAGTFTLRLCVTDDELETTCCTVNVSAALACTPPPVPTIESCPVSWDRRPVVEVPPLPAGQRYELLADGVPYGTIATTGQNWHRPGSPLGAGGAPPGTGVELVVRACLTSDAACCSTSEPVTINLIESCTTPVAPSADNIVFSEYVINGDGSCPGASCEAGEAIEITNLSHCPVALNGSHFGYCNPGSCSGVRWLDFGAADIIPPRGVYVAIRNQPASSCSYPFFGPNDPSLFGLQISALSMMGNNLASGWFNNGGGGMGRLRVADGAFVDLTSGATYELIAPYSGSADECESIGFNAVDQCGDISPVSTPTEVLTPNQLGRLWRPCDAIAAPFPDTCN